MLDFEHFLIKKNYENINKNIKNIQFKSYNSENTA